jgi:hypothetical protein
LHENFNPNAMDDLHVIENPNKAGWYWVFNGQHRYSAAVAKYGRDIQLPCRLYKDLSETELAMVAHLSNTGQVAWIPVDDFLVLKHAKDKDTLIIDKIVKDHGLKIAMGSDDGMVSAVRALQRVYKRYGSDVLGKTLDVLRGAWGLDRNAYSGQVIEGVAAVLGRYESEVSNGGLSSRLAKSGGPARFLGKAKDLKQFEGGTLATAVSILVVKTYNHARRTKKLPKWE